MSPAEAQPAAALDAPNPPLGSAAQRVEVIEDSLRCFAYGWLSCVPFLGVAYLLPALRRFVRAGRLTAAWNPARGYLAAGLALAGIGWLLALTIWPVVIGAPLTAFEIIDPDGNEWVGVILLALLCGLLPALAAWSIALATVWKWWAERVRGVVRWTLVATIWITLIGLLLASRRAYRLHLWGDSYEGWLPDWLRYFGLALWAGWLFGGLVLLARREAKLRTWGIWLFGLAALSLLFVMV